MSGEVSDARGGVSGLGEWLVGLVTPLHQMISQHCPHTFSNKNNVFGIT